MHQHDCTKSMFKMISKKKIKKREEKKRKEKERKEKKKEGWEKEKGKAEPWLCWGRMRGGLSLFFFVCGTAKRGMRVYAYALWVCGCVCSGVAYGCVRVWLSMRACSAVQLRPRVLCARAFSYTAVLGPSSETSISPARTAAPATTCLSDSAVGTVSTLWPAEWPRTAPV